MTLLTAVQNVADEATYTVDSSVVGTTDITTKQLLAIANRVIDEMFRMYEWPQLWKSGSITLSASDANYALPEDFSHYHFDTFWNQSDRWRVYGPMTPQYYAEVVGYGVDAEVFDRFAIRGTTDEQILISPTPGTGDAGNIIIYEYQCARPVRPQTWVTGTTYAANAYVFYNGNYYQNTGTSDTASTAPTHTSGSVADGSITWTFYDGKYETFLADTDVPVLNQKILEQGMLERFSERHGLPFQPRFEQLCSDEFNKRVPGKILTAQGGPDTFVWAENDVVRFKS